MHAIAHDPLREELPARDLPGHAKPAVVRDGRLSGVLDELEDHNDKNDQDQHSNHGPQPWGHCCQVLDGHRREPAAY
jgi:hypothetical protein